MCVCGILIPRPDFYPPAYEESLDAKKQPCPAGGEALGVPPPLYTEIGLEFEDAMDARPEAPPSYEESVAGRAPAATSLQDAERQSRGCWCRGYSLMLRTRPHGLQLLIINAATGLWEGKCLLGPPEVLAEEMLGMTAMQFHQCAWPARAPEGCGQQPATFQWIRANPSPGGLWDQFWSSAPRGFWLSLNPLPSPQSPGAGTQVLLVGQPGAYRHYITQQLREESVLETKGHCGFICGFCWLVL